MEKMDFHRGALQDERAERSPEAVPLIEVLPRRLVMLSKVLYATLSSNA